MVVKRIWYHANASMGFLWMLPNITSYFFVYKGQYEVDIVCVYKKVLQRSNGWNGWKPKPIWKAEKSIILWCEQNNYYTVALMVKMFFIY